MIYVGVDTGKNGAIAMLDGKKAYVEPFSEKGLIEMLDLALMSDRVTVAVEKVGAMPFPGRSGRGDTRSRTGRRDIRLRSMRKIWSFWKDRQETRRRTCLQKRPAGLKF